jgi:hypothetical protein
MPFITLRDGRRLWLEQWEIDMIMAEPPELGKWLREDAAAFAAQRRALPLSASVTPVGAPRVTTVGDPKPSGLVDPAPLKTPHVEQADRVAESFAKRDRLERIIAEMVEERRKK